MVMTVWLNIQHVAKQDDIDACWNPLGIGTVRVDCVQSAVITILNAGDCLDDKNLS